MSFGKQELHMPLKDFVSIFPLPQRAKVTMGYYEVGESETNREFAAEDTIDVRRVICPFVCLTYTDPKTGQSGRASVTIKLPFRFQVVTRQDAENLPSPQVFNNVQETVSAWPLAVRALEDHVPTEGRIVRFQEGDRLRLVRIAVTPNGQKTLELKSKQTGELIQLPMTYVGKFAELGDRRLYTLLELVEIAPVRRTLKLFSHDPNVAPIPGIPRGYDGVIVLEKPMLLVEVCGIFPPDLKEETGASKFLVPIDCEIEMSPRDVNYLCQVENFLDLGKLMTQVEKSYSDYPFVVRVIDWKEETTILQNQVVRPGDLLVIYGRDTVCKIRARIGTRTVLIPVNHPGNFSLSSRNTGKNSNGPFLCLQQLENACFPFSVTYSSEVDCPYSNQADSLLEELTEKDPMVFESFEKDEPCVIVSKLFSDAIGAGFHLPLRTGLQVRYHSSWKRPEKTPRNLSASNCFAEEVGLASSVVRAGPPNRAR